MSPQPPGLFHHLLYCPLYGGCNLANLQNGLDCHQVQAHNNNNNAEANHDEDMLDSTEDAEDNLVIAEQPPAQLHVQQDELVDSFNNIYANNLPPPQVEMAQPEPEHPDDFHVDPLQQAEQEEMAMLEDNVNVPGDVVTFLPHLCLCLD
jgi:hypothetical protein